ncbi:MAG: hypothetical protein H6723_06645 [Sandaracinus sp.]|nr:hypothetical protein [Sandaracinus sp.]
MSSGDAYCWGSNTNGVAGVDSTTMSSGPKPSGRGLDRVVDIDTSGAASCAVEATGLAYCWGTNADGQLGQPADTLPGTLQSPTGPRPHWCDSDRCGAFVIRAPSSVGRCFLLGRQRCGQLGIGSRDPASGVQTVLTIDDAIDVEAGGDTTCVRRLGGGVWCWGALRADGETGGGPLRQRRWTRRCNQSLAAPSTSARASSRGESSVGESTEHS